jgi:xanthine dehydrogenase accessory factor
VVRTENATSAKAGAHAIVFRDGSIRGFLGGSCVQGAVRAAAAAALQERAPRLIRVRPKEEVVAAVDVDGTALYKSSCPSGGTIELFVEPMRRAHRIIVCGASPVAQACAELAPRLGYRIAVAALAEDQAAFSEPEQRVTGFDLAGLAVDADDFIVVATQGRRDREALAAALASPAGYVAFVGSRRKARALTDQLRAQGLGEAPLARLHAPAGLDIGAIDPGEIALSILGEIIAWRRRGVKRGGSEAAAPADTQAGAKSAG